MTDIKAQLDAGRVQMAQWVCDHPELTPEQIAEHWAAFHQAADDLEWETSEAGRRDREAIARDLFGEELAPDAPGIANVGRDLAGIIRRDARAVFERRAGGRSLPVSGCRAVRRPHGARRAVRTRSSKSAAISIAAGADGPPEPPRGPALLVSDTEESLRALGVGVWPSVRAFREWLPGSGVPFAVVGRRHVARLADVLAAIGLPDRAPAEPAAKVYEEAEVIAMASRPRRKAGAL
jgi:hypothetical protein